MKLKLELPQIIEVRDYHEFDEIEDTLNQLGISPKIKLKEVGFDGYCYVGIAYAGNLKAKKNKFVLKKLRLRCAELTNDID
jgi:hypothetical protein